jgi:hypothetical protein
MNEIRSTIDASGPYPKVLLRYPQEGLVVEVHETLRGDPHWAEVEVGDLAADLVARGWNSSEAGLDENRGVEFLRVTYEGLRVWVDGRQVRSTDAVRALGRGMVEVVRLAAQELHSTS